MLKYNHEGYNGWKNRETWNVALWIANDEQLYRWARSHMKYYTGRAYYRTFIHAYHLDRTPDGISYLDPSLSLQELNGFMRELRKEA